MAGKFPNRRKHVDNWIQEGQRSQIRKIQRNAHKDTLQSNCQNLDKENF